MLWLCACGVGEWGPSRGGECVHVYVWRGGVGACPAMSDHAMLLYASAAAAVWARAPRSVLSLWNPGAHPRLVCASGVHACALLWAGGVRALGCVCAPLSYVTCMHVCFEAPLDGGAGAVSLEASALLLAPPLEFVWPPVVFFFLGFLPVYCEG